MKKRETNRFIKERRDSQGRLLCLVPICNKLRQKYKKSNKTRNYCENHSWLDMREFTNWSALRNKVLKRDNFTCVKCGDDRKKVEVIIKDKRTTNWLEVINNPTKKFKYEYFERKQIRTNLIADHIISIALGGDEWDLGNNQTLCLKCDKIKTKEDIKKIAKLRRKEKLLLNGQKTIVI